MNTVGLKWHHLVTLANKGKVRIGETTLTISPLLLPEVHLSPDGVKGFVRFAVDDKGALPIDTPGPWVS